MMVVVVVKKSDGGAAPPPLLLLALLGALRLLALPLAQAVEVENTCMQSEFFLEIFPSGKAFGNVLKNINEEEVFHVDWEERKDIWRLPDFHRFVTVEAQEALNGLAIMKANLENLIKRSNRTQGQNVAPSARVYPEDPVELGEPNVLICFVNEFSPPLLNITWLKNGEVVSKGVQETTFYPSISVDFTYRKFSYLTFIPEEGDIYTCQVDHWGLRESLTRSWYSKIPTAVPKTADNVVCVLGLAFATLGIVAGPILFFKARKMIEANHRRDGI